MANTHLHSLIEDDYVRRTQAEMILFWLGRKATAKDAIFVMGDFNANPDSSTYAAFKEAGFLSAFEQVNGREPAQTFPTGLQAPFIDKDPPGTFDYIFYKGPSNLTPLSAELSGDAAREGDPSVYGSDHLAVCATFALP